eukprot:GHVT01075003.1.p1 GENE.GHVT01075003.1~~GHVT01075003.1.p1  ORF type:complete len:110 (+),score=21.10 GHVT01075003.1:523-852(+)
MNEEVSKKVNRVLPLVLSLLRPAGVRFQAGECQDPSLGPKDESLALPKPWPAASRRPPSPTRSSSLTCDANCSQAARISWVAAPSLVAARQEKEAGEPVILLTAAAVQL